MALSDRAELLTEKLRFNQSDGIPSRPTLFVDETSNFNNQRGATAAEVVIFGDIESREYLGRRGNDHIYGGAGDDFVHGAAGQDYLEGNNGNDELYGEVGNDILLGQLGNDKLDGGTGVDRMNGGAGNDIYIVDNSGDKVVEMENGGLDEVLASAGFSLGAHVENLALTGMGNISGTGNNLDNRITGNSGNNQLTGMGGNDFLEGGIGFDTYIYHSGDGVDQIEDSDAQGQIIFDGRILQGGIHRAGDTADTYTSLDGKTTYLMSGTDLIVNGVLIVNENFQSGQMGIHLRDMSRLPINTGMPSGLFGNVLVGDASNETLIATSPYSYAMYGNEGSDVITSNVLPLFDLFDDLRDGGPGDDILVGAGGNDYLVGGSGDDYADVSDGYFSWGRWQ
jgi:Ca2+-binding RTX toxin-like protein